MKKKKEKKPLNMKRQWIKFGIVTALYLLFLLWVKSWLGLLVVPFIYDAYITKKINWQWWKDREGPVRFIMSWVDAIVFALVAVYFINQFFFQNYVIPSSSLEKSLLTGDYLFVSKLSYGPRIPQTPLTVPLTQHTLPIGGMKSYIEWPHWDYRRVSGLGHVELNDIVVFNYPAGDTICGNMPYQTEYYHLCYQFGRQAYEEQRPGLLALMDSMPKLEQLRFNSIIYLDGKANKEPDLAQFSYDVEFVDHAVLTDDFMKDNGITCEDLAADETGRTESEISYLRSSLRSNGQVVMNKRHLIVPLTRQARKALETRRDIVVSISEHHDSTSWVLYPQNGNTHWTCDNYGPVWIPKKGVTVDLADSVKLGHDVWTNYAIYERCIRAYEGNKLDIRNGQIYINDQPTTKYTFKLDYYWMMGDNRHNSADSRYWGFVPEDHIVGKPIFIWWSSDPDRSWFSGIRWSRLFRMVDNIK